MRSILQKLLIVQLLLFAGQANANNTNTTDWYWVKAHGQQVGYLSVRSFSDPRDHQIVTEVENHTLMKRMGGDFNSGSKTRFIESAGEAKPLQFSYRYYLSDEQMLQSEGVIHENTLDLKVHQYEAQSSQKTAIASQQFSFPTGERIKQVFKNHFHDPLGASFAYQTLHLALAPEVVQAQATLEGTEKAGHKEFKRFAIINPKDPDNVVYELRDEDGKLYKAYSNQQGTELVYASSRIISLPLTGHSNMDSMLTTMIRTNHPILRPRETKKGQYLLSSLTQAGFKIPEDSRQKVIQATVKGLMVQVIPKEPDNALTEYPISFDPKYLQSTPYLQSTDPQIVQVAKQVIQGEKRAYYAAILLQNWVYHHINKKDLSVGFASAKETLETQQGDCTEHAVLLAALNRATGIPARVAVGLEYLPGEDDSTGFFVYHMWTEVFIGNKVSGEWVALDATNPQPLVDATHIKLADSDLGSANDPILLSQQVSQLMGKLSLDVLQTEAPGQTVISLSNQEENVIALTPHLDLNQLDIRELSQQSIPQFTFTPADGVGSTLEERLTMGVGQLSQGNYSQGMNTLEQVEGFAKTPLEHLYLGNRYIGLELFDAAQHALELASHENPGYERFTKALMQEYTPSKRLASSLEPDYFRAIGLTSQPDKIPEVQALFREIIKKAPEFSPAYLHLGKLALTQQDYSEAQTAFRNYIGILPEDPRGYHGLAQVYFAQKHYDRASQELQRALLLAHHRQSWPNQQEQEAIQAELKIAQGKALIQREPRGVTGYLILAKGLMAQKRYASAMEIYNQALALKPKSPEALLGNFHLLQQFGAWDDAADLAKLIKGIAAKNPVASYELGRYEVHQRNYETARQWLNRAITLDPRQPEPYLAMANLLDRQNNLKAAISLLRQGLERSSNKVVLRYELAKRLRFEMPSQAVQLLEENIQLNPLDANAWSLLGQTQFSQNALEDAKISLHSALVIEPNAPETLTLLGDAYAAENNLNDALYYYQKAMKIAPDFVPTRHSLSMLIDQYQLKLKKPKTYIQLTEDERDYLSGLLGLQVRVEYDLMDFQNILKNTHLSPDNTLENQIQLKLHAVEDFYHRNMNRYQSFEKIVPPRRFVSLHQGLAQFLYANLNLMRAIQPILPNLEKYATFDDVPDLTQNVTKSTSEKTFWVHLEATSARGPYQAYIDAALRYDAQMVALIRALSPTDRKALILESQLPLSNGVSAPTHSEAPDRPGSGHE